MRCARGPEVDAELARKVEENLQFATRISPDTAAAWLVLARVQFSIGQEKIDQCWKNAEQAYTKATAGRDVQRAVVVQAARLYCYGRFQQDGAAAAVLPEFRRIATSGRDTARDLFSREPTQAQFRYNYAPAYWVARSHYEEGRAAYRNQRMDQAKPAYEQARQAYEAFRQLVEGRDLPAEASRWEREYQNTINTLSTF